ncbi:hypothetical protein AAC387_Pa02g1520 [Persea americana]
MVPEGVKKCGFVRKLDNRQKGKKQVMDGCKVRQCSAILNKLITHPAGWVFNQPVDPVKLNIPDYFSIISHPMDLGTIKSKLETKSYSDTEEFAADVSLTFSNAMRYNPPHNDVHSMAKELFSIFCSRWKSLEAKWKEDDSFILEPPISKKTKIPTANSRGICHKTPAFSNSLVSRSMMSTNKQKLLKDLAQLSNGNMPPRLHKFLQKFGSLRQNGSKIEVDISAVDEKTVCELQRIIKDYLDARSFESSDVNSSCGDGSQQDLSKGRGNCKRSKCGSANDNLYEKSSACLNSRFSPPNDLKQADIDSDKFSVRKNHACSGHSLNSDRLGCKETAGSMPRSNVDPNINGTGKVVVEESHQPGSHPATPPATCREGEDFPCAEQLSPSKALRAAILRSRFAGIIVKTQQKTLLNHSEKEDPVKLQRLKEQLEKQQQEERARIEAQLRAAEASARMQAEAELKMQRQREREAARIALQKIEKTVDIDENRAVLKDLEMLACTHPAIDASINSVDGGALNPLERLGLFMKNDDLEEEEEDI